LLKKISAHGKMVIKIGIKNARIDNQAVAKFGYNTKCDNCY